MKKPGGQFGHKRPDVAERCRKQIGPMNPAYGKRWHEKLIGKRFGRLIVISELNQINHRDYIWMCRCDCGKLIKTRGNNLKSGDTRSCGCLKRESGILVGLANMKHGDARNIVPRFKLYSVWANIKGRCYNQKTPNFKYYGQKGIRVYKKWRTNYVVFKKWALATGYQPTLTIDRIDNNKGYYPSNCQWLTKSENSKKRQRENGN